MKTKTKELSQLFAHALVLGALTIGTLSCGSDDDNDDNDDNRPQEEQEGPLRGEYRIIFTPLNAGLAGNATVGRGEIDIDNEFEVDIDVTGAPTGTHMQNLNFGSRCPQASDDTNDDGIIDANEALVASGKFLIPLDNDLNAQDLGGNFPSGSSYSYEDTGTVDVLVADLWLPDTDSDDSVTKLESGTDLTIEGRVVTLHGLPSNTVLPATAGSIDGKPAHEVMPIACGEIVRVNDN